jgi:hypothetical protein
MHTLLAYGLKRLLCRLQCAHFLTGTHPQSYTMLTILGVYRPNRHELTASHTDTVAPAMSLCTKFWRLHHEFCMSNCRGYNHEFGILSFRGWYIKLRRQHPQIFMPNTRGSLWLDPKEANSLQNHALHHAEKSHKLLYEQSRSFLLPCRLLSSTS